jgi:pimeloyl-ACP methyl ester carboxylesterase
MPDAAREELLQKGIWLRPSANGHEPHLVAKALIEEGRNHLLLGGAIRAHCPVHILHGMRDEDVPWQSAMELAEHLAGDPVSLTLIKDGGHRLSREEDLARIAKAVAALTAGKETAS